MKKVNKEAVAAFWLEFCQSDPKYKHLERLKPEAWGFGDTPEMAEELGALVMAGKKVATTSLYRAYKGHEEELPQVGAFDIVLDGKGEPLCVIENRALWICHFNEVDERHAFEEGEGDQSMDYWKREHIRFFSKYDEEMGVPFSEEDLVVCERFQKVYP